VRPGRVVEQLGDASAQPQCLLQQRPVEVRGLVPVLEEQGAAVLAVGRLLHEGGDLGVVQADAIGPRRVARLQSLDEALGQPVQPLAGDLDPVAELREVASEGDLQLHQAGAQPLQLGALRRLQLVPRAPQVAHPVLQQELALSRERGGLIGRGEGADRAVHVVAEDDRHAPLVDPLLGGMPRLAHGGIGMDVAHECAASIADRHLAAGQLQRAERGVEAGVAGGGHRSLDEGVGAG
jgi:hypothetical protein